MQYSHISVLPAEVIQQIGCTRGRTIVDCTLGGAGHSEAILKSIGDNGFLLGIDRDEAAIDAAKERLARFSRHFALYRGDFADLDKALAQSGLKEVDGFLLDLGLSSRQLDEAGRGFSYQADAPLDMRFDHSMKTSAAEVVNNYSEVDLAAVIKKYGEERWADRIAAFIVAARKKSPVTTTGELVKVIKAAVPASARRRGGHPARRTFQALRIEVNQELDSLKRALEIMPGHLRSGGRIVVISYHSLEDRLVKNFFRRMSAACECPPGMPVCVCKKKPVLKVITAKPIRPAKTEIEKNPRARSARLRTAEKV